MKCENCDKWVLIFWAVRGGVGLCKKCYNKYKWEINRKQREGVLKILKGE